MNQCQIYNIYIYIYVYTHACLVDLVCIHWHIVTSAMKKDHAVLLLNMMNLFQRQVKKTSLRFILPLRMLPLWGWFRVYLGLV